MNTKLLITSNIAILVVNTIPGSRFTKNCNWFDWGARLSIPSMLDHQCDSPLITTIWTHILPLHVTLASSVCAQLCSPQPLFGHSLILLSNPEHARSSMWIAPTPCVKWAQQWDAFADEYPSCLNVMIKNEINLCCNFFFN